jgi:hypothetical protein
MLHIYSSVYSIDQVTYVSFTKKLFVYYKKTFYLVGSSLRLGSTTILLDYTPKRHYQRSQDVSHQIDRPLMRSQSLHIFKDMPFVQLQITALLPQEGGHSTAAYMF